MSRPPLRIEDVPGCLRSLRAEAGDPSYAEIARRVTAQRSGHGGVVSRATVYDCFREGRRRFDVALVIGIVRALVTEPIVRSWVSALAVLGQRTAAAALVDVTATVPPATAPFVGRTHELTRLARPSSAHWIHAMPGAGKSTLARQAARNAIAAGAVEGAIIADLRGHSPAGPPADPDAVTRAALRLLGDKSNGLSASAARRMLRSRLQSSRTMLVLDDAASLEQVRSILPLPSGVSVIVTSRVVPAESWFQPLPLALFAPYESLALLDAMAGRDAIAQDPASAEVLLELMGHQPLAVSITAARVAARDTWTLADHVELARARRAGVHLDEPITRSLDLTYQLLPDTAQRLLRALAHHPVALLDRDSIDAVAGDLAPETDAALDVLETHSLIAPAASGRIHMHELIRVYAADVGLEIDSPSERQAAADRLRRSVVDRAWSAHRTRSRSRRAVGRAPRAAVRDAGLSEVEAEEFLAGSLDLLLHIALTADRHGDGGVDGGGRGDGGVEGDIAIVNLIAETIDDALHRAGRGEDAVTLFREALRVARLRTDAEGELRALVDLGATLTLMGRAAEAEAVLSSIDEEAEGWWSEAPLAHNARGTSRLLQGRFDEARSALEAGLAAASRLGDRWREGLLWNSIALLHLHTGDLAACRIALERSIDISTECGDLSAAARGRVNLAKLLHDQGDHAAAETEARTALSEMEALGYVPGIAVAYSNLSAAVCALGRFAESATLAERGRAVARDAGMRQTELELLRTSGRSRLGEGRVDDARGAFELARDLADALGDRLAAAACAEDLGDCAHAARDRAEARSRWEQAVEGYRAVSSPDAADVEGKLAALLGRRGGGDEAALTVPSPDGVGREKPGR
ncbi:NB-ARC domain-containing protein [Microbacterium aurum]